MTTDFWNEFTIEYAENNEMENAVSPLAIEKARKIVEALELEPVRCSIYDLKPNQVHVDNDANGGVVIELYERANDLCTFHITVWNNGMITPYLSSIHLKHELKDDYHMTLKTIALDLGVLKIGEEVNDYDLLLKQCRDRIDKKNDE